MIPTRRSLERPVRQPAESQRPHHSQAVQRTDYGGVWKVALDRYFEPFLRLCFPAVHAVIDWSHNAIPLDQELQEVAKDAEIAKHRVDKLFQVRRHNGAEDSILVHLAVQIQPDRQLPQRLYRYYCRIRDRFDRRVVTLAAVVILAHRIAQERRNDSVQREASKWALTRQWYEQGYRKEDVQELFRVIDWLVRLPAEQEVEFRRKIAEYEAQKHTL